VAGLSVEDKQLDHEADHLTPSSVEFENEWRYTFTSPGGHLAFTVAALLYVAMYLL
jgi:hypothetical protein